MAHLRVGAGREPPVGVERGVGEGTRRRRARPGRTADSSIARIAPPARRLGLRTRSRSGRSSGRVSSTRSGDRRRLGRRRRGLEAGRSSGSSGTARTKLTTSQIWSSVSNPGMGRHLGPVDPLGDPPVEVDRAPAPLVRPLDQVRRPERVVPDVERLRPEVHLGDQEARGSRGRRGRAGACRAGLGDAVGSALAFSANVLVGRLGHQAAILAGGGSGSRGLSARNFATPSGSGLTARPATSCEPAWPSSFSAW